jgi:inhibitor of KinA
MNSPISSYRIFPLGDSAITVDFGNIIDEITNKKVLALFKQLSADPLAGMIEAVPAYSSLTVYYDVFSTSKTLNAAKSVYEFMAGKLEERLKQPIETNSEAPGVVDIPVCYENEFAPDIEQLAKEKNISVEEVILIHSSKQYRVYMLGFLPGFSYMGEVDERIAVGRKSQPRQVAAGSVGIAGKQTGIYPSASPGGWQIIGRTPLKLFDAEHGSTLLKAGDTVQFISISQNDFNEIQNSPIHLWRGAGGDV